VLLTLMISAIFSSKSFHSITKLSSFHRLNSHRQREINTKVDDDSQEAKMRRTMCKMWTNFAKFNDPTPLSENPLPFRWKSSTKNEKATYLVIDDEKKTRMVESMNEDRLNFWRGVYGKWNKGLVPSKL
jgi:carboxylesterase type B